MITIRPADTGDNILLADLGRRTFSDAFAGDNTPEDMAAYLAASFSPQKQAQELAAPLSHVLIAEVDGAPVGYAGLRHRAAFHPSFALVWLLAGYVSMGVVETAVVSRAAPRDARAFGEAAAD